MNCPGHANPLVERRTKTPQFSASCNSKVISLYLTLTHPLNIKYFSRRETAVLFPKVGVSNANWESFH